MLGEAGCKKDVCVDQVGEDRKPIKLTGRLSAANQYTVGKSAVSVQENLRKIGIDMQIDQQEPQTVLLVPQYHYRPWNLYALFAELKVYEYPVDALPTAPEDPPPALLRLTRALADENRLRILRFLAGGRRSFTEVVHDSAHSLLLLINDILVFSRIGSGTW